MKVDSDAIDSDLVQSARTGDKDAIQRLFARLLPRTRNLVRYLIRGDQDVDDMSQQALLQIWRGLDSYRGDGTFRAFADRIVARSVFATLKRRPEETCVLDAELVADERDAASAYVQRRELVRALDLLPSEQRGALVIHRLLGWSIEDAAKESGVSVETFRSRLRLGLGRLRKMMTDADSPANQADPRASEVFT